jgi:hypothetical protein
VAYPPTHEAVDPVDMNGDHAAEYLHRGAWISPAALYGPDGRLLWRSDESSGVDDAAAGNVDGQGKLEVVVGYNGDGGVRLFDATGRQRWRAEGGNVWHVELADLDGDGRDEVLHSNGGGELTVLDGAGRRIRRVKPQVAGRVYFDKFAVCRWPSRKDPPRVIHGAQGAFFVLDGEGRKLARLKAPGAGGYAAPRATLVGLGPNGSDWLAVAFGQGLYVYDGQGQLVFRAVQDVEQPAVATLSDGKSESLLVAARGRAVRYRRAGAEGQSRHGDRGGERVAGGGGGGARGEGAVSDPGGR